MKEKKLQTIIIILLLIVSTETIFIAASIENLTKKQETTEITGIQKMYERFLEQEKEQTEYFKNKYYNAQLFYMALWNATIDCHETKFPFII